MMVVVMDVTSARYVTDSSSSSSEIGDELFIEETFSASRRASDA